MFDGRLDVAVMMANVGDLRKHASLQLADNVTHIRDEHGHGAWPLDNCLRHRHRLLPFNDVVRRAGDVDPTPPPPSPAAIKNRVLPVRIRDQRKLLLAKPALNATQGEFFPTGWLSFSRAGLVACSINSVRLSRLFSCSIEPQNRRNKQTPMHVRVFLQRRPVKPVRSVVTEVPALRSAHFVAHQNMGVRRHRRHRQNFHYQLQLRWPVAVGLDSQTALVVVAPSRLPSPFASLCFSL